MPELPEVETVKRGLLPHCKNTVIDEVIIRQPQLRWPIPKTLEQYLTGQTIVNIERRSKYLLFQLSKGTLIIHLGMSGILRIIDSTTPASKHDHADFVLNNHMIIRFNDPRRFGAILFTPDPLSQHPLFKHLGPEPLSDAFTSNHVFQQTRQKKTSIKSWLMNNHNVVGVGNIYATEVLFLCNLHPELPAGKLTDIESITLCQTVKKVLKKAISAGGTTIKDFKNSQGKPGYFAQQLFVYGKIGDQCPWCQYPLQASKISNRQTVFCSNCQPDLSQR